MATIQSKPKLFRAGVSLLALGLSGSAALAGGFGLREQSATAQGMSFAGAAAGSGGLSSIYWNPATITMQPGFNSQYNASLINLDAKITPTVGTSPLLGTLPSGNLGETAVVPSTYSSYQLTDQIWIGLSSTAPYGLVTKPNYLWAGQIYARTSRIYSANFNPIVGFKLTDWLSVAIGPTVEYFDVKLRRATSFLPTAPTATLRGSDVGVGFTAGLTLTPVAGTTIGVGYRSSINHELDGKLNTTATVLPIRSNLNTPELVTVGVTQAITPDFRLNAGYEFTNWSRLGTVAQVSKLTGFPVNALPLRYRDGHFVSFGGEYDISRQWTVRAGAGYEWSPVTDATRSPVIPDTNRIWASLGGSYHWNEKLTFDLAYSHVFGERARINIVPGNPLLVSAPIPGVGIVPLNLVATTQGDVDILSAAIRYRWDDPRVAEAAPIVRKY